MIDLLKHSDPAAGLEVDTERLRSRVEDHIGDVTTLEKRSGRTARHPWVYAVAGFALVLVVAVPTLFMRESPSIFSPRIGGIGEVQGVDDVVSLASGGVQTAAVDGDTIWALTSLAHELQEISATSGEVVATYPIDEYAEGVSVAGGHLWLLGYDNGGEVLRFDPEQGLVVGRTPLGGLPAHAVWFEESFWVSTDRGQLHRIDIDGRIVSSMPGELKGQALGLLWARLPETGLITSLNEDGSAGEFSIPIEGDIRSLIGVDGDVWLLDGDYPMGRKVTRFDPDTGEMTSVDLGPGLLDIREHDDAVWVTSNTDGLLYRIDPTDEQVTRYTVPGKPGGYVVADDSLWVSLYHPGALIRLDTADLLVSGPIAADAGILPHRLVCTGEGGPGLPTVLLEPYEWTDYGSWSVVQAMLSAEGLLVCANGYVEEGSSLADRAEDMEATLVDADIPGPFVVVAHGDGVHPARLFADGRDDVTGVVLVDPMPLGFQSFYDTLLPDLAGHPPFADLEPVVSDALGDFGVSPLVVIGHDPEVVYLSDGFTEAVGPVVAGQVNDYWQEGLAFYAGLSSDSSQIVAEGTGLHLVVWDSPDLVVEQILDVMARAGE